MVPRVQKAGRIGGALTRPDLFGKKIILSEPLLTAPSQPLGPIINSTSGPFLPPCYPCPSCTTLPAPFPFLQTA